MKKIFLISPVRKPKKNWIKRLAEWLRIIPDLYELEQKKIEKYVEKLESQGHEVYWPKRNTDQNDPIGLDICINNGFGIFRSNEIHFWWVGSSGSLFDFGMTFMLWLLFTHLHLLSGKKIIIANPEDVKPTEGKSFENVLLELQKKTGQNQRRPETLEEYWTRIMNTE